MSCGGVVFMSRRNIRNHRNGSVPAASGIGLPYGSNQANLQKSKSEYFKAKIKHWGNQEPQIRSVGTPLTSPPVGTPLPSRGGAGVGSVISKI